MEPRTVGREGAHLKLMLAQDGEVREGIAFRLGALAGALPERVDALFSASIHTWQDRRNVQCEIRHLEPHAPVGAFQALCVRKENAFFRAICQQILYNRDIQPPAEPHVRMLDTAALDEAIRAALAADAQGALLVVHTLSALRKWTVRLAVMQARLAYTLGLPEDRRAFNTLCAAPSFVDAAALGSPLVRYARIVLLDGALEARELAGWRALYPEAELLCADDAGSLLFGALSPHVPTDDALRALYKTLRAAPKSLGALAEQARCTEPAACIGMHVLQELGLADWRFAPWQVSLTPPRKTDLNDSVLLRALRAQIAEGGG
jgi:hypothetical protein